jgi:gamma-glutamylcyclotransferase (GGCT)/AIG2-like uncharacterized protein YtfP
MSESGGDDPDELPVGVFVYGTLRPGRANWPVAEPYCAGHQPAALPGFGLYALAYPVVAPLGATGEADPPASPGVRGDLLRLHPPRADQALARLDAFEGVDPRRRERSYYERIRAEVVTDDGNRHLAWVYVPGDDLRSQIGPAHRVAGDDWPR